MLDVLVVVDMQNDFVDGALGTSEAVAMVPRVEERIRSFDGQVYFTMDTHPANYLETLEGRNLPVPHCIKGTPGWHLVPAVEKLTRLPNAENPIEKDTFGSSELAHALSIENDTYGIRSVTLIGLCTDICVISNALVIKTFLPQVPVKVDASCCAGVTPESHLRALSAMKSCQIEILNENADRG